MGMTVRFKKMYLAEMVTPLGETMDKQFYRFDELTCESVNQVGNGRFSELVTPEGMAYLHVPNEIFEVLP